jgi:hypothetical protein
MQLLKPSQGHQKRHDSETGQVPPNIYMSPHNTILQGMHPISVPLKQGADVYIAERHDFFVIFSPPPPINST